MEPLQAVLKRFVCIGALPVLKFYLIVIILCDFVNKLTNKKRYQSVKSIFFVADIIMPQNFFKFIYDFIVFPTKEQAEKEYKKLLFYSRKYAGSFLQEYKLKIKTDSDCCNR